MPLFQIPGSWFINAIGWTLVDCLWQGLLIWTLLQMLLRATRGSDPRLRYGISSAALTGIAVWFLVDLVRQCLLQSSLVIPDGGHTGIMPAALSAIYQSQAQAAPQAVSLVSRWLQLLQSSFPVLSMGYFAGVLICAIRLTSAGIRAGLLRGKGVCLPPAALERRLEALKDLMAIRRPIRLKLSLHIDVPLVTGWLKPVILIPVAALTRLSPEQLEAILIHEMAHIRRQDYLVNLLQCITETLLCFNPMVWSISSTIRKERENCCDDLVLAEVNPLSYARALVALEEQRNHASSLVLAAVNGRPQLFQRIKRMMEMKRSKLQGSQMLPTLMILALAVASMAWLNPSHGPKGAPASGPTPKTRIQALDTVPQGSAESVDSEGGRIVRLTTDSQTNGLVVESIHSGLREEGDSGNGGEKGQPLFIINGKVASGLNGVNPGQIERISILRDSTAQNRYGNRGANGVVLITTRRGGPVIYEVNGKQEGAIGGGMNPDAFKAFRIKGDSAGNAMFLVTGKSPSGDIAWAQSNSKMGYYLAGRDSIPDEFSIPVPDEPFTSYWAMNRKAFGMDSTVWKKDVERMISQLKQQKDLMKRLNQKDWDLIRKQMTLARKQYEVAIHTMARDSIKLNYAIKYSLRNMDSLRMKNFAFADSFRVKDWPRLKIKMDSLKFRYFRDTANMKMNMDSLMVRIKNKNWNRQMNMEMRNMKNFQMKMNSRPFVINDSWSGNGTGRVQVAVQEMVSSHLISDPDKYSVDLEKDALIIDGKKQSRETFEKYRDMVGAQTTFQVKHDHGRHESMNVNSSPDKKSD